MIDLKMVGVDHNRAAIEYRERFAFTKAAATVAMRQIKDQYGVCGCVVLSTCNRTELWVSGAEHCPPPAALLCAVKGAELAANAPYLVERQGTDAVSHLFATACGLNSKVFGEDQIITQVNDALALAHDCGCADSVFERLFRTAVTAAKRVKTTMHLTALDSSVATRAVDLLDAQLGGTLAGTRCLVIGNGEMGRLAASSLVARGCDVCMTLRQYKAGNAAVPQGCTAIAYDDRYAALQNTRVVVSATSSPHHTLRLEETLPYLDGSPKLMIDLAMPRDISSRLGKAPGVALYDIDSLGGAVGEATGTAQARLVLDEYQAEFEAWYYFRGLVPKINDISAQAATDITGRIGKSIQRLDIDAKEQENLRELIENASAKVVSRMMYGLRENLDRALWDDCIHCFEKTAMK